MKIILSTLVFTLLVNLTFAQENSFENVSEELKSELIYYNVVDEMRSTSFTQTNGTTKTSSYRIITVSYRKGINGEIHTLDKKGHDNKGVNLKALIKSDKAASLILDKALKHKNSKFKNGALKVTCYTGGIVFAAMAFFAHRDNSLPSTSEVPTEKSKKPLIFGILSGSCFVGGIYFHLKDDKDQDLFKENLVKSLDMYNKNLIDNQ